MNDITYDQMIYYENLLASYYNRVFENGLDVKDLKRVRNILKYLEQNEYFMYYEYKELASFIYDGLGLISLKKYLINEVSLLSLVYTNNKSNYIINYSANKSNRFLCQFHHEKKPSMGVTERTCVNKSDLFHCFGCGTGGNVIDYIKEYENLTDKEAINLLSAIYLIDINNNTYKENNSVVKKYQDTLLNPKFKEFLEKCIDKAIKNGNERNIEGYVRDLDSIDRISMNIHITLPNISNCEKILKIDNPFHI